MKIKSSEYPAFREKMLGMGVSEDRLYKAADLYSKIPFYIRAAIENLEPLGVAGTISQILSETKAQREQENVWRMMYYLAQGIDQNGSKIEQMNEVYLKEQLPLLTDRYFEESIKTHVHEKIRLFRNIWINGLLSTDRSLSEKTIIFDIIASLTEDEITALKYFWEKTNELRGKKKTATVHIVVDDIAQAVGVDKTYAQQLCIRLRSQGLVSDTSEGWAIGHGPPEKFAIMKFTEVLLRYISDPPLGD